MPAGSHDRYVHSPVRFPTRLDRFTAAFFCGLTLATVVFAILIAEPREGLIDGIAPSLLMTLFLLPQYYLIWCLYRHRRRQQIAERQETW